jgi:hypothetical protein
MSPFQPVFPVRDSLLQYKIKYWWYTETEKFYLVVNQLKCLRNPALFNEFLELNLRTLKCGSEDATRNTELPYHTGLHSFHWLDDCEWRIETDVEGNGRDPLKVIYDNLPGITDENYNRYSEINTFLGLYLNTRPPKLQPYPFNAVFANEWLFKAACQVTTAFRQTLYKYMYM